MTAVLVSAKVSVFFTARSHKLHSILPKGSTWHFIETKAIKHDYYSSIIVIALRTECKKKK